MNISKIHALEILDSRGNPTIKTYVELENGTIGWASVPSGASTGTHETHELRDENPHRYLGKGVQKAISNIETTINEALKDMSIEGLSAIDKKMIALDRSENKHILGGNAILSVSLAVCRALSLYQKKPLWKMLHEYYFSSVKPAFPRLMVNIVNGGIHANWNFDIQEFIIIPEENKPHKAVQIASEVFHHLGTIFQKKQLSTLVGDEGGYSPQLSSNGEVFNYIIQAINQASYSETIDFDLGIDMAASSFYREGKYILKKGNRTMSLSDLVQYYLDLQCGLSLFSFEDPFHEEDWEGFATLTRELITEGLVIGDDLYATNTERIKKGIEMKATNAVLIKPNQIGTVFETVEAIRMTQDARLKTIISHRSGETEDSFIADLAVACAADFLKAGSMSRSERLAKYNRLIEIEKLELI